MQRLKIIAIITMLVMFFNIMIVNKPQSIAIDYLDENKELNDLDENYLNNENLAIGMFFTVNIEKMNQKMK